MRSAIIALVASLAYGTAAFAYDPLDCLNDAVEVDSTIPVGLATRLCSAAWTPEPARCYPMASALDDGIPRFVAVDLCAGTVDAAKTIECYIRAGTQRKLNRGLATTLCGAKKPEK